jgi:hypothetical protein
MAVDTIEKGRDDSGNTVQDNKINEASMVVSVVLYTLFMLLQAEASSVKLLK